MNQKGFCVLSNTKCDSRELQIFWGYWRDSFKTRLWLNSHLVFVGTDEMMRFLTQQVAAIEENLQVLVTDDVPFRSFNLPEWDKHYSLS